MKLQLLRNATLVVETEGKKLLIDPMLGRMGAYDPFRFTASNKRNPTVDLPIGEDELAKLLTCVDAVLLTHIHLDHWDAKAKELLPRDMPIFCQPFDVNTITGDGFVNVTAIDNSIKYRGITFVRTSGRHGTGDIGKRMGTVSGYVIDTGNHRLYIAGDTIWCDEVRDAITAYQPTHIVVNGGGARFVTGDPIVMNTADIISLCSYAPSVPKYVVHLEAVNHATETREEIRTTLLGAGISNCHIPNDGDWLF